MTKAKQDAGSDATVVTLDLSQEVVQGIQSGDIDAIARFAQKNTR